MWSSGPRSRNSESLIIPSELNQHNAPFQKGLVQGGTLTQKDTKEEDKKDNDRKDDEEHGQGDQKKEDSNNEDATNLLSLLPSPMEMEGDDSNDPQNAEVEAMAEF